VDQQINEAHARFKNWCNGDEAVVFPLIADIHAARPLSSNPPDFRDTKFHVLFAQRAALTFNADLFAELGDIGFDRNLSWKPSKKRDALMRLESRRNLYKDFPLPVLFCMGNHDSGRAYGNVFSELKLSAGDYVTLVNRTRTMLVDMVALKPARREMKIFRIGAGGPERDRVFVF